MNRRLLTTNSSEYHLIFLCISASPRYGNVLVSRYHSLSAHQVIRIVTGIYVINPCNKQTFLFTFIQIYMYYLQVELVILHCILLYTASKLHLAF